MKNDSLTVYSFKGSVGLQHQILITIHNNFEKIIIFGKNDNGFKNPTDMCHWSKDVIRGGQTV